MFCTEKLGYSSPCVRAQPGAGYFLPACIAQEETQALPEHGLAHLVWRVPEGGDFCKRGADNWVQCRYPECEGLNPCPQAEPALTEGVPWGRGGLQTPLAPGFAGDFSHQLHPGLRRTAHTQTSPHTEGYIFPSQQESIFGVQRSAGIWQEIIVPHEAFTKHLL